jgi:hypothetical protein
MSTFLSSPGEVRIRYGMLFTCTSVTEPIKGGKAITEATYTSAALFAGKDAHVQAIYTRLLEALRTLGPVKDDPKKTSIHLVHISGFAGAHPRKSYLYLNLRTARRKPLWF